MTEDRTAALTINGEIIEESMIRREAERLRPDYERVFAYLDPQERESQLLDWSRENVIERVLINQHAKKTDKSIPQAEIEAALAELKKRCQSPEQLFEEFGAEDEEKVKAAIELQMKVERLMGEVCEGISEPSDDEILKFYNENKGRFKSAEQIRVSHIVKHINWQADEAAALEEIGKVENELKQGSVFEVLAAKYSDCPENGGDLGYITKGQMVEEFEDVAFNLGLGQVSEIFRTRFGFHIVKLYDRKPAIVPGLEEIRQRIVSELKEQIQKKAIEDFIDQLKSEAKIMND